MPTFAQKQRQPQKLRFSSPAQSKSKMATSAPFHGEQSILPLQRTIGNQAVQRMLQTAAEGTVQFKLAPGAGMITAQEVITAFVPAALGPGPEAPAMVERLLKLPDAALIEVLREVAARDPREVPPIAPLVEGDSVLDMLEREAEHLPSLSRFRLLRATRSARQRRTYPLTEHKKPAPPSHQEPGRKQREREEQAFQEQLATGKKHAAWNVNVAHRGSWPKIRRLLDAERGNIDLRYLLGWIDQESGGDVTKKHPNHRLDEVSLFQISNEERGFLRINTPEMRARLLSDLPTAVHEGLRLMRFQEQRLIRKGFTESSPALWQFVRLMHMVGEPSTERWVDEMKSEFDKGHGVNPFTATWDAIKEHARVHPKRKFPVAVLRKIDIMIERGNLILQVLDAAGR